MPARNPGFITRKPDGFHFQKRIPAKLRRLLGTSPLRLPLRTSNRRVALWLARHLSNVADGRFRAIISGALIVTTDTARKNVWDDLFEHLEKIDQLPDCPVKFNPVNGEMWPIAEIQVAATYLTDEEFSRRYDNWLSGADDLTGAPTHLENVGDVVERIAASYEREIRSLRMPADTRQSLVALTEQLLEAQQRMEARMEKDSPKPVLLSEAIDQFLTFKRRSLKAHSKEPMYFAHRLNFLSDFLCLEAKLADPDLRAITPDHLSDFFELLRHLPRDHTTKPELRSLSTLEAAKFNRDRKEGPRYQTLNESTARDQYVDKIKTFFAHCQKRYGIADPFATDFVAVPDFENVALDRRSHTVEEINRLFAEAASRSDPAEVWLLVLAFFTGGRLGELVNLRKADIQVINGTRMICLSAKTTEIDENGAEIETVRQVKNRQSRRDIALHDLLEAIGFVHWAENQFDGPLFPALVRADRPSDAASKRMARLYKAAGIHEATTSVFHSLRHTYRDLMRDNDIAEETADKQVGHTPKSQGRMYGTRFLRPKEVGKLRGLEMPAGLDLGPYERVLDMVLHYDHLVDWKRYERDLKDRSGDADLESGAEWEKSRDSPITRSATGKVRAAARKLARRVPRAAAE